MSKTVEEILDSYKYMRMNGTEKGYSGLTKDEATEAINQLLIEARLDELNHIETIGDDMAYWTWTADGDLEKAIGVGDRIAELQSTLKEGE